MDSHKNPNLETTHNHHHRRHSAVPSSQDLKVFIKNLQRSDTESSCLLGLATDDQRRRSEMVVDESSSGRERLKRHRVEMSGRVWIPDIWGQEDLLNNWIDCTIFDSSLNNTSIISAREALIQEATSTLSC